MARRKQKFTFVHLLLFAAVLIWLPRLIGHLTGVSVDTTDSGHVDKQSAETIDVDPVSQIQSPDRDASGESQLRPAPAGLVLSETLISSSGKTAVINGLAFREGQMLTSTGFPLRIRSILAGRVILEGDGGLYELRRKEFFK